MPAHLRFARKSCSAKTPYRPDELKRNGFLPSKLSRFERNASDVPVSLVMVIVLPSSTDETKMNEWMKHEASSENLSLSASHSIECYVAEMHQEPSNASVNGHWIETEYRRRRRDVVDTLLRTINVFRKVQNPSKLHFILVFFLHFVHLSLLPSIDSLLLYLEPSRAPLPVCKCKLTYFQFERKFTHFISNE